MEVRRSGTELRSAAPAVRSIITALVLMAAVGASACGAHYVRATAPPIQPQPETSVTRHVVLVSIDGLRPDAISAYGAPTLGRLLNEGAYTLAANTIHPSKTLPSHTSMLTGQPPDRHGVLWNNVATADADSIDLYWFECDTPLCQSGEQVRLTHASTRALTPHPNAGGERLANLAAASTFYVSPSGELLFYATEHDNDGPSATVKAGE